jgi:hypothetical protein
MMIQEANLCRNNPIPVTKDVQKFEYHLSELTSSNYCSDIEVLSLYHCIARINAISIVTSFSAVSESHSTSYCSETCSHLLVICARSLHSHYEWSTTVLTHLKTDEHCYPYDGPLIVQEQQEGNRNSSTTGFPFSATDRSLLNTYFCSQAVV